MQLGIRKRSWHGLALVLFPTWHKLRPLKKRWKMPESSLQLACKNLSSKRVRALIGKVWIKLEGIFF